MELIKAAAIKCNNGIVVTGKDHAQCITKFYNREHLRDSIQGFITSNEKFVTRKAAGKIAWQAKQINIDPKGQLLFSEEIWSYGLCYYDKTTERYEFKDQSLK